MSVKRVEGQLIGVIGAGSGGLAFAAFLRKRGYAVEVWNRSKGILYQIEDRGIVLDECAYRVDSFCYLSSLTDSCRLLLITTTANAHASIARKLAPHLTEEHTVVLMPGRTGGALEVRRIFNQAGVYPHVAEAQSLLFACRHDGNRVEIIAKKKQVHLAALPASDTDYVLSQLDMFPEFVKAENVLQTSLMNYGAILHPAITLVNAGNIDSGNDFLF